MFKNNFNSQNQGFPQMKIGGRCPICEAMYDFQSLQILAEKDHSLLVYMECSVCQASIVSILSLDPRGMSAQGLVTDLTPEEITKAGFAEPVSADDVLEMHEALKEEKPVNNFI